MVGKNIYDIGKDEMREATQEDVDALYASLQVSGLMVKALRILQPDLVPPSGSPGFLEVLKARLTGFIRE